MLVSLVFVYMTALPVLNFCGNHPIRIKNLVRIIAICQDLVQYI